MRASALLALEMLLNSPQRRCSTTATSPGLPFQSEIWCASHQRRLSGAQTQHFASSPMSANGMLQRGTDVAGECLLWAACAKSGAELRRGAEDDGSEPKPTDATRSSNGGCLGADLTLEPKGFALRPATEIAPIIASKTSDHWSRLKKPPQAEKNLQRVENSRRRTSLGHE